MKKSIVITASLLIMLMMNSFGQLPDLSDPMYNQTVPNLISMRHKAISHTVSLIETTAADFLNLSNKECIDIYVVYEIDSKVGKSTTRADLINVPDKLMDMYIIYNYNYRVFYTTENGLTDKLPNILLTPDCSVKKIDGGCTFMKEGNVKEKKLKKSSIKYELIDSIMVVQLNESNLKDSSYVDLNIQIKSKNFLRIKPTTSPSRGYSRSLTFSCPMVFSYQIPDRSDFKILYDSTSAFILLHFFRNPGVGNGNISLVDVSSRIRSWEIINKEDLINEGIAFVLDRLNIPPGLDIGIDPVKLLAAEE